MVKHRKPQTHANPTVVLPTTNVCTTCTKCGKEDDHMYQFRICSACFKKMYEVPRDKQMEQIRAGHDYLSDGRWIVLCARDETKRIPHDSW